MSQAKNYRTNYGNPQESNIISQLSGSMTMGYVKNIPHDNISLDTEHKDTWQISQAKSSIDMKNTA